MRSIVYSIPVLLLFLFVSCSERTVDQQVEEWIADNAIPLKTVQAGSGFDDLKPLKEIVGDARIVSLGEPTHGNRYTSYSAKCCMAMNLLEYSLSTPHMQ